MDLKTIGSTEGRSPTPRLSHAHRAIAHTTLPTLHHQCPWTKYPPSPAFITASTILTHPRRRNPSIHPSCPRPASAEDYSACDDSATTDRFSTLGAAEAVRRSSTRPLRYRKKRFKRCRCIRPSHVCARLQPGRARSECISLPA
jgi:hypothetical protein